MTKNIQNNDNLPCRVGIAVSHFHGSVTGNLLKGAMAELQSAGLEESAIDVVHVPGAFELPLALALFCQSETDYDALVLLGCVIRGETSHFDFICTEVSRSCMDLSTKHCIPVGFGLLTVDTMLQAERRSDPAVAGNRQAEAVKQGEATSSNKGIEAARAALDMVAIKRERFSI